MAGQSVIVATGAIDYPPEYQAMSPEGLSRIGISKVMTITSTYDHRIVQGAESGAFLALIDELLLGQHEFYDQIFADLGIQLPALSMGDRCKPRDTRRRAPPRCRSQASSRVRVDQRVSSSRPPDRRSRSARLARRSVSSRARHRDLRADDLGPRSRSSSPAASAARRTRRLREILDHLHDYYCGKVGIEYRHIQSPEEKEWIRARVETQPPPVPVEVKKQILWKLISAELFERFLGTKYLGQKRFSIEGNETVIAVLDQLIEGAAAARHRRHNLRHGPSRPA